MNAKYGFVKNDFRSYKKLEDIMSDSSYTEESFKELNLTKQRASMLPSPKIMSVLTSLSYLDLSFNKLSRMRTRELVRACPLLQTLHLDSNNIHTLQDIQKLGSLKHLEELTFIKNPVSQKTSHMHILKNLLFPKTIQKKDIVEILTATYVNISNTPEKRATIQVDSSNMIYVDDLKDDHLITYLHERDKETSWGQPAPKRDQDWFMQLKDKPCPIRKIGQFKALLSLNYKVIKIGQIFEITGFHRSDQILMNEAEENAKIKVKKIQKLIAESEEVHYNTKANPKTQEMYIKRHKKKMQRKEEEFEPILYLDKDVQDKEKSYLNVIFKIDQINSLRSQARKSWYNHTELWERPDILKDLGKGKVYSLSEVKREGVKLKKRKAALLEKQRQGKEKFKAKLARVYKTKKFKDDTDFEKHFPNHQDMDIEPSKLQKYERDLITKSSKRRPKYNIKLKLESHVDDFQVSPSELESDSDMGRSDQSLVMMDHHESLRSPTMSHQNTREKDKSDSYRKINSRKNSDHHSQLRSATKNENHKSMNSQSDQEDDEESLIKVTEEGEGAEGQERPKKEGSSSSVLKKRNSKNKANFDEKMYWRNQLFDKFCVQNYTGNLDLKKKNQNSKNSLKQNQQKSKQADLEIRKSKKSTQRNTKILNSLKILNNNQKSETINNSTHTHSNKNIKRRKSRNQNSENFQDLETYMVNRTPSPSLPINQVPIPESKNPKNTKSQQIIRAQSPDPKSSQQQPSSQQNFTKLNSSSSLHPPEGPITSGRPMTANQVAFDTYLKQQEFKRSKISIMISRQGHRAQSMSTKSKNDNFRSQPSFNPNQFIINKKRDRRDVLLTRPGSQYISTYKKKQSHNQKKMAIIDAKYKGARLPVYQSSNNLTVRGQREELKKRKAKSRKIREMHKKVVLKNRKVDYQVFNQPQNGVSYKLFLSSYTTTISVI